MDPTAWSTFSPFMEPGESIVWTGKPNSPARVARAAAGQYVLGVFILAILVLGGYLIRPELGWLLSGGINWRDPISSILANPWGLVPLVILAGGLLTIAKPLLAYRRAMQTEYAVTNHRVLRVRGKQIKWLRVADMGEPEIRTRPDGIGDVWFRLRTGVDDPDVYYDTDGSRVRRPDPFREFLGIRNPEEVRQLIRELTQKARLDATQESRTTFRSLRNRRHAFTIEVPEKWEPGGVDATGISIGSIAFEQIGEEWNSVTFSGPEGALLRIAIEEKAPQSLEEVSARLQSFLQLTLGEITTARSGTIAGGLPHYEFESRMLGQRGRQIFFYHAGREYTLSCNAPNDNFSLYEETFSHVVNSLRLERGTQWDAPSAAFASQAAPAAESAQTAKPRTRHRFSQNTGFILALCVLSLFLDTLGYVLAPAGLFLLWRHRKLKLPSRLAVTAMVLLPKAAIFWLSRSGSTDMVFQLEPRTFATSSSVWAWSLLACGIGFGCLILANAIRRGSMSAIRLGKASFPLHPNQNPGRKGPAVAICGLLGIAFVAGSALIFSGWEDDFQAIEPGEGGKWRLTHLVRGTVVSFSPVEVESITGERDSGDDAYLSTRWIRVRLRDGRSWSMNTRSMDADEVLKKLAGTMDLPPGVMRLRMTLGPEWVNSGRKVRLEDWVGTYRSTAGQGPSADSVLEFRIVEGRLVGKETLRHGEQEMSRELRNIQMTPDGEIEFEAETIGSANQQGKSEYRFSLHYAPRRRATLHEDFLEVDGTRYEHLKETPQ